MGWKNRRLIGVSRDLYRRLLVAWDTVHRVGSILFSTTIDSLFSVRVQFLSSALPAVQTLVAAFDGHYGDACAGLVGVVGLVLDGRQLLQRPDVIIHVENVQ